MAVIQITSDDTWQIQADGHPLRGSLQVPGDKSISHRALMLGAIAEGTTHIEGLLVGEDTCSTAACFRALGAEISHLNPTAVTVQGLGIGHLQEPGGCAECRQFWYDDATTAGGIGSTNRSLFLQSLGMPHCDRAPWHGSLPPCCRWVLRFGGVNTIAVPP